MRIKHRPQFFAFYKDFNTGEMKTVEVLKVVFDELLTSKGKVRKYVKNVIDKAGRAGLSNIIQTELRYHYWARCEWEFIIVDWPYRDDSIEKNRSIKVDVYAQIEPNLDLIVDLVEEYIKDRF